LRFDLLIEILLGDLVIADGCNYGFRVVRRRARHSERYKNECGGNYSQCL